MDDELRAVVEVLNRVLPDQGLVVALVLDDAGEAVFFDLLAHQPLGDEVFKVADRANVFLRVLARAQTHAALLAGEFGHLVLIGGGVDQLTADRAFGPVALRLVKDHVIAAVGALAGGDLVRVHVDGVAAGAVDLFAREKSSPRLRIFPAIRAFDNKFRHSIQPPTSACLFSTIIFLILMSDAS